MTETTFDILRFVVPVILNYLLMICMLEANFLRVASWWVLTLDTKLIFILYLEIKSKNYIELSNLIDFSLQVTAAI